MRDNFNASMALVFKAEGGKVDDPRDNGGRTNMGVTQRTYDAWRTSQGLSRKDVWGMPKSEAAALYRARFWNAVDGDLLPKGVDYLCFSCGVLSGPKRAIQWLQKAVGVPQDGAIGPMTLAAVTKFSPRVIVTLISDARLSFYHGLTDWPTYGRGWSNRTNAEKAAALDMIDGGNS